MNSCSIFSYVPTTEYEVDDDTIDAVNKLERLVELNSKERIGALSRPEDDELKKLQTNFPVDDKVEL